MLRDGKNVAVERPSEIRSLTSLRGIAAILVVFVHANGHITFGRYIDFGLGIWTNFIFEGHIWVDMFFILSGFVIALSGRSYFYGKSFRTGYSNFILARFARIYPLHISLLCAFLALEAAKVLSSRGHEWFFSSPDSAWILVNNVLLTHAWGGLHGLSLNYPSWSISAEWGAYLLFPLLLALFYGRSMLASLILIIASLAVLEASVGVLTGQLWVINLSYDFGVMRSLCEFSIGIVLCSLYSSRHHSSSLINVFGTDGVCIALAISAVISMNSRFPDIIVIGIFIGLVMSLALNKGFCAALLGRRAVHRLGQISYSIYMVHAFLLNVVFTVVDLSGIEIDKVEAWALSIVYFTLLIVVSEISYRVIENPARAFITRRWQHRALSPIVQAT